MKIVHSEIYLNKIIEIVIGLENYRYCYAVMINGNALIPRGGGVSDGSYSDIKKAISAAKSSIKKNMSKADEIKRIENEIAELQAKLESLKNS